jgi:Rad51
MEWPIWWNSIDSDIKFSPVSSLCDYCIPTGIPDLDASLNGGLIPGKIYEIVGEAGTGKTNLCLEILKHISSTHSAYYLSTQKPASHSRLASIGLATSSIYLRHSSSLDQSFYYIYQELPQLLNHINIKLFILDNIYSLVQDVSDEHTKKTGICSGIAIVLKYLSVKYQLGLLVINNVVSNMNGGIVPGLGRNWSNYVNHRWVIDKKSGQRVLKVVLSGCSEIGKEFVMVINNESVVLVANHNM